MPIRPRTVSISQQHIYNDSSVLEPARKIIRIDDSNASMVQSGSSNPVKANLVRKSNTVSCPSGAQKLESTETLSMIRPEQAEGKLTKQEQESSQLPLISPATHNPRVSNGKFVCGFDGCDYMSVYNSNMWRHQRKYNHFVSGNITL